MRSVPRRRRLHALLFGYLANLASLEDGALPAPLPRED